jgi:hypothetical protein
VLVPSIALNDGLLISLVAPVQIKNGTPFRVPFFNYFRRRTGFSI